MAPRLGVRDDDGVAYFLGGDKGLRPLSTLQRLGEIDLHLGHLARLNADRHRLRGGLAHKPHLAVVPCGEGNRGERRLSQEDLADVDLGKRQNTDREGAGLQGAKVGDSSANGNGRF